MRFKIFIGVVVCAVTNLAAQQVYTDTFKLAEQQNTASMDAYLLDLVNQQAEMLHANDTVDTLTMAELQRLDSIAREISSIKASRRRVRRVVATLDNLRGRISRCCI